MAAVSSAAPPVEAQPAPAAKPSLARMREERPPAEDNAEAKKKKAGAAASPAVAGAPAGVDAKTKAALKGERPLDEAEIERQVRKLGATTAQLEKRSKMSDAETLDQMLPKNMQTAQRKMFQDMVLTPEKQALSDAMFGADDPNVTDRTIDGAMEQIKNSMGHKQARDFGAIASRITDKKKTAASSKKNKKKSGVQRTPEQEKKHAEMAEALHRKQQQKRDPTAAKTSGMVEKVQKITASMKNSDPSLTAEEKHRRFAQSIKETQAEITKTTAETIKSSKREGIKSQPGIEALSQGDLLDKLVAKAAPKPAAKPAAAPAAPAPSASPAVANRPSVDKRKQKRQQQRLQLTASPAPTIPASAPASTPAPTIPTIPTSAPSSASAPVPVASAPVASAPAPVASAPAPVASTVASAVASEAKQ